MKHCVLTIGNFDGLHVGHQALIQETVKQAKALQLPSVLITFEPHPDEFFTQQKGIRLMRARDKYEGLKNLGIDYVLRLRFNSELAKMTAEDFLEHYLMAKLGMKVIVIGDDFRFGAKRLGDVHLLEKLAENKDFSVVSIPSCQLEGGRISSTRIRAALADGNLMLVQRLLGRPFSISGRVIHGDKRGRELGYPTANIALPWKIPPLKGIFSVQVKGLDKTYRGVASLGTRPMFDGGKYILEVHIFDFDEMIYGRLIKIEFLEKLRDEKKFHSVEELILQMDDDARRARL